MKITICDSENASREILISYIHQFSRTYAMVVSILEYASGEALLHAVKDNFSNRVWIFLSGNTSYRDEWDYDSTRTQRYWL